MTQPTLLELAKQGNPKAISALLNQKLKDHGIRSRVAIKDGCLHVLLHAEQQIPERELMVDLVRVNLLNLDADTIFRAIVYGRKTGEEKPAWSQLLISTGDDFQLVSFENTEPEMVSEDLESGDLSSSTLSIRNVHFLHLGIIGILFAMGLGLVYLLLSSQQHRQNYHPPAQGSLEFCITLV